MCGVKLADRLNARELMQRLGIKDTVIENVQQGSMRWLGHVLRNNDDEFVKKARSFEFEGSRGRGR